MFPLLSPFFIQICFLLRQTVGGQPFARPSKGGEELERRLHEEREAREGRGRKREKEEWREAGTRGRDETERERLSGEKKKGNKMKW